MFCFHPNQAQADSIRDTNIKQPTLSNDCVYLQTLKWFTSFITRICMYFKNHTPHHFHLWELGKKIKREGYMVIYLHDIEISTVDVGSTNVPGVNSSFILISIFASAHQIPGWNIEHNRVKIRRIQYYLALVQKCMRNDSFAS